MEATKARSNIRFRPDPNTLAWITKSKTLSLEHVALVENESYKGCCILTNQETGLKTTDRCFVRVGAQNAIEAEVRWVQVIEPGLYRMGFMYIE